MRRPGRRPALAAAAVLTVALGLGVRGLGEGAWTGPAGDALYAVLVYVLVAFVLPRRPRAFVALLAVGVCAGIELFQLTGLPAELGRAWPPARLVLGTTFGLADLAAYAVGVAAAWTADSAADRPAP
ncbi:DUF2809 domain-containing protein [Zafaria sp. J156]|uniref:ribosomal maturation YjgA family protein n=1 Tax=Zafaria sp. J156 TaxID=3116490 RepID=UPI002E798EE0|nr:DUF2809 domain-containing protein [Zafaria sp. J156]MEE1620991.1 DUF2809 domain-containing protein [Zafaria sp. J156]